MIKVNDLSFSYNKKEIILDQLQMHVPKGAIYGFLGANGAGKSTTIRAILGLLKPDQGQIEVMGSRNLKNDFKQYAKIGSLIEAPSLYGHLSARDNLKIVSRYQHQPYRKIDEILDRVGLTNTKSKKVSKFSMGMKQRLGLAIATIHDPDLLILDEPVNGLDPNGILEIRSFLQWLKSEGKTILLSSHLLSEIEKMATHVGILRDGKMVYEGGIEDLALLQQRALSIQIKSNKPLGIKKLFEDKCEKTSESTNIIRVVNEDEISKIVAVIIGAGIDIYEVQQLKDSLENLFIDLTNKKEAL